MIFYLQVYFFALVIKSYFTFSFGIDFGSELNKSAFVIPGKFYTSVEDQMSKRKSESVITFCDDKKFYEYQALQKSLKKNCDSYQYLQRFFEKNNEEFLKDIENINNLFLDEYQTIQDEIGLLFEIKNENFSHITIDRNLNKNKKEENSNNGEAKEDNKNEEKGNQDNKNEKNSVLEAEQKYLRLEEIFGLLLKNVKKNAETTAGIKFDGASLNIWDNNLSVQSRKKLLSALKLAGLDPVSFQHENTASIIYHISQNFDNNPKLNKNVLIINIGALSTKLSFVNMFAAKEVRKDKKIEYYPGVKVLFDMTRFNFSGKSLNKCLVDFVLENNTTKTPKHKMMKLFEGINKSKETLTVNKSTGIHIEDFFEDLPLSKKFTKEDFENKCEKNFAELTKIFDDFKSELNKQYLNIDEIEIIGGTVRIPKVNEMIRDYFKLKIGTHMNGDNGPSLGAALIAANYTNGTRTRKVLMEDGPNYSVNVTIKFANGENEEKKTELYKYKSKYGSKKNIALKDVNSNLYLNLEVPQNDFKINYKIKGIPVIMDKYKTHNVTSSKVYLMFELDLFGIPKLQGAELRIEEFIPEVKNKTRNNKNTNTTEIIQETVYSKQDVKEKLNVVLIDQSYTGLFENKTEFDISKNILKDLDDYDVLVKKISQQKNKLESIIYKIQDILENEEFNKFLSPEEKINFEEKFKENEEFLFAKNLGKSSIADYARRIKYLNSLIFPFETRKKEFELRKDLSQNTFKLIANYTSEANELKNIKPWIPLEKIENILEKIKETANYLSQKFEEQNSRALYLNPILSINEVDEKIEILKREINKLKRIKKPKEEEKNKNIDKKVKKKSDLNDLPDILNEEQKKVLKEKMENVENLENPDILKNDDFIKEVVTEENIKKTDTPHLNEEL